MIKKPTRNQRNQPIQLKLKNSDKLAFETSCKNGGYEARKILRILSKAENIEELNEFVRGSDFSHFVLLAKLVLYIEHIQHSAESIINYENHSDSAKQRQLKSLNDGFYSLSAIVHAESIERLETLLASNKIKVTNEFMHF